MSKRAPNRKSRKTRTLGEMISTFSFFGMSGWLLLEALSLMEQAPAWQVGGLYGAAFCCFLGGFRFVIAAAWEDIRKGRAR
ncbi:hypothetical protein LSUCC0031_04545 [Rhodobacterales bacterium LSUCC0031]|nr:hypothetical protein [Rhodobacterales bacterium LSUCC0031]